MKTKISVAIVFNRFTHHQVALCDSLSKLCDSFYVVQMDDLGDEWTLKGKKIRASDYEYLLTYNDSKEKCHDIFNKFDVIISGVGLKMFKKRLKSHKITFVYLERFYKKNINFFNFFKLFFGTILHHSIYQRYKPLLLCASGYCAGDAAVFNNYRNRCYKFGYFPETNDYDFDKLFLLKKKQILWAGRLIDWKHPEIFIKSVHLLIKKHNDLKVLICGDGVLKKDMLDLCCKLNIESNVSFIGDVSNSELKRIMQESSIFVATSDFQEGWGVVVNEAMNSGCAVVASYQMGSVPFLISNGINGFITHNNPDEIALYANMLLGDNASLRNICKNAFFTIRDEWNPKTASLRIVSFSESLLRNKKLSFGHGPLSPAKPIKQKDMQEVLLK